LIFSDNREEFLPAADYRPVALELTAEKGIAGLGASPARCWLAHLAVG